MSVSSGYPAFENKPRLELEFYRTVLKELIIEHTNCSELDYMKKVEEMKERFPEIDFK